MCVHVLLVRRYPIRMELPGFIFFTSSFPLKAAVIKQQQRLVLNEAVNKSPILPCSSAPQTLILSSTSTGDTKKILYVVKGTPVLNVGFCFFLNLFENHFHTFA